MLCVQTACYFVYSIKCVPPTVTIFFAGSCGEESPDKSVTGISI